jgi:DNA-binding response OmpR family regulator
MDGLAVLKRWRAAGRLTPVLVLTARGAWPERVEGIDAGADDYLPKPFRMEELLPARGRSSAARWGTAHRLSTLDRSASMRARCV